MAYDQPLTQVREAISGNMYPQGPVFHWRDGWYFCRGEGMCVHIWNSDGNVVELTIPDAEWDSIVGFLSYPRAQTPPQRPGEKIIEATRELAPR